MEFFVYILYSESIDKYYVGYTNDLQRRLSEHNRIKGKYTDKGIPWKLVYTEHFSTKAEAQTREKQMKSKKSRKYIEWIIANNI